MKHSGIEWIGDIPSNWEIKRFKYLVSEISSGDSLTNEMLSDDDTLYPVFGGGKQIGYYEKSNVTSSNILIGRVGVNCGCITKLTGKAWATDSALIVNSNDITNYLYYLLLTTNLNNLSDANAQPLITASKVLNIKIPFCIDIQEQQAIAIFLDTQCSQIDKIITELEQQIDILKQYKTSLITETVTKGLNKNVPMKNSGIDWIGKIPAHWEVKRLKYIGNAKNGLTYSPEDISNEGVLVLRSSNIQEGKLTFEDNVYVDMKIPKEIIVRENDILICSRNGSRELIGKCALIDKKTEGNSYGAFMCVFRSPYNRFIHYIFQSNLFNYYLGNYLTSTINQLTNTNLHNMKIPITFGEKEQSQIVTYLDNQISKINNLLSEKQQSIDTMKAYKKSLIYEYVTGKTRIKGYS